LREQVAHRGGFHRAGDDGPLAGVRRSHLIPLVVAAIGD
jgi:hypothetical protein